MRKFESLALLFILFSFSPVILAEEFPQSATAGVEAENLKKQIPHKQKVKRLPEGIYGNIKCTKVIDAATIEIATGKKVRLIGVSVADAMNKEALGLVKNLAEGRNVRLEFDAQMKDSHGRLLAYVFIPMYQLKDLADYRNLSRLELFLNAEIIEKGYANLLTLSPNVKYADLFKKLYQEARDNKRGLWKNDTPRSRVGNVRIPQAEACGGNLEE